MGFIKKLIRKAKKSLKRMSHGKFHLTSGLVNKHDWRSKLLPKNLRRSWGGLKKSHKLRLDRLSPGNNSAASYSYVSNSPYVGSGYRYTGRRLSEMV